MPLRPAHQVLRDATRDAHERVDAAFGSFDLKDIDGYRAFLSAHAEALLPIEAWLDANHPETIVPDWSARRRGNLLLDDLATLDGSQPSFAEFAIAPAPETMIGVMYVIEGSRLGGRFLARQVASDLPRTYLDPDQDPGKWQLFLSLLDEFLYDDASRGRAVQGALLAFDRFERAGLDWTKARA